MSTTSVDAMLVEWGDRMFYGSSSSAVAGASQQPRSFSLVAGQSAKRCHASPAHQLRCRGSRA